VSDIPNFGQLLAPFISRVPDHARPRFLALLERGAADRYRSWASELPAEAPVLLACAKREDEIADRVEALYPIPDALARELEEPLPLARETYLSVFAELAIPDQLRIQAAAERQGAAAWRAIAASQSDPAVGTELERCAALEEASADALDRICAR